MDLRDRPPREMVPFDGPVDAVVVPPGSKSLTNRAVLAAALGRGTSVLRGALRAEDTAAMLECVSAMGALVEVDGTTIRIEGCAGRPTSGGHLDARQSGTTARFVAAALALCDGESTLDADDAMRRRPMVETFEALRSLGATIIDTDGSLPARISGPIPPSEMPPTVRLAADVSSQFASGLLLAGPCMPSGLRVELDGPVVSRPYLDMTVAVMRSFGAHVDLGPSTFTIAPRGYEATDYAIEPDASAASYFFAAAAITGGSVTIEGLGTESLQGDLRFVDVLEAMGAQVDRTATATTVHGGALRGVLADMSQMSDTAQTAAAVAVFADGDTVIEGIGFIRRKETDRIAAMVTELTRLGVDASELDDGISIASGRRPVGTTVETYDDHRMAMSLALIGLRIPGVVIDDPGCVAKTFPHYFEEIERLRPGGVT